jgi:hypothetical protein
VCSVVGADFLFASGTMFVSESVSPHEQSVAGGVFQTMTQVGCFLLLLFWPSFPMNRC